MKYIDETLDEIISLMASIEDDGTIWGHDTDLGPIECLRDEIKELIGMGSCFTGLQEDEFRKTGCKYFECSDGDDEQYPKCKHWDDFSICPVLRMLTSCQGIQEIAQYGKLL